ncbi:hypothetical protein LHJ74_21650 [Streptomyces sp. N2-109]|uniref:Uncharacterized protein n=1 Tax=Streptomyces gossypii TaxID=2883101 RepID=A0ABT2JYR1_9ACTN|nr:hypothetical protein [Streptomyces gossypii]MCT2592480.1 hypothetical protein [Streptomyces gossypii]
MDPATEDNTGPDWNARAAAAIGIAAALGVLTLAGLDLAQGPVDCDSKFAVELPDSAENVECSSKDRHSAQWRFTMPTDEVEPWWAQQSQSQLELEAWLSTEGRFQGEEIVEGPLGVNAYYPEDEGGLIWVNPQSDGTSQVFINGAWK